ncbi:hypothetical protein [Hanstruepera marina]|uniref:hypothetical protein n=1 Tax=Hanstruepera marina TaxID=2873265 RepID=UPI001CA6EF16|nr:hypothetical protein [Hanstruepera marina]
MYIKNRQSELFKEYKIESYLSKIRESILKKIEKYNDIYILNADINKETDKILYKFDLVTLKVPTLNKETISSSITNHKISGHRFPKNIKVDPNEEYEIEQVNHLVSFVGNEELFNYSPNSINPKTVKACLHSDTLELTLSNWNKIRGNQETIEKLKKEFSDDLDIIETNLSALKKDVNLFKNDIKAEINKFFTQKKNLIIKENKTLEKLKTL